MFHLLQSNSSNFTFSINWKRSYHIKTTVQNTLKYCLNHPAEFRITSKTNSLSLLIETIHYIFKKKRSKTHSITLNDSYQIKEYKKKINIGYYIQSNQTFYFSQSHTSRTSTVSHSFSFRCYYYLTNLILIYK